MFVLLAVCCTLFGHVQAPSGAPLPSAVVSVEGDNGRIHKSAATDVHGDFSLTLAPGAYDVYTSDRGYAGAVVNVALNADTHIVVALQPVDSPAVRTIATVTVDGRLTPVRGEIPSVNLTRTDMDRLGFSRSIDAIAQYPSVTFSRPDGGASSAISVISLRGPDPSETLIGLDGQLLNDGNTGDLDLSRFPIEAFTNVELTEGLGPADRDTSNTIGGEVNFISLQPTQNAHSAFSLSAGSFGWSDAWLNTTGTNSKLGYALALDSQAQAGYVNETHVVTDPGSGASAPVALGSNLWSRSALINVNYAPSAHSAIDARIFTLSNWRDQSSSVNGIDANAGSPTFGSFIGPGSQTFAQQIRAYQLRGRAAAGSGDLVAEFSSSDNDVTLAGGVGNAMYDLSHNDKRTTETLFWQREFENSSYSLGTTQRQESLVAPGTLPLLSQSISNYFVRASQQFTPKLRVDGALYAAHYSTFGSNTDGRVGLLYTPDSNDTGRLSVGTGFRAPLLIERFVFDPANLPPPDANCIVSGQGNPNEQPEHATEYEAGWTHRFANALLDASLYRTNLRDPIENFYPVPACPTVQYSFPINVGSVVYEGAELSFAQRFVKQHLFLTARYGLNVAYPNGLPVTVSNPTSGAYLVNGEQFQGIPQQQGSLELDYARAGWHAAARSTFRGRGNELNRTPYSITNLALGFTTQRNLDFTLAGTNVFNGAAGRYTLFGGGVPYRGLTNVDPTNPLSGTLTQLPTDQYSVEPFGVRFIITERL